MSLNMKVSISVNVMARVVGDEAVILDLESGTYYGLDPVGARVWQLLVAGLTLMQVCDALTAEFDVPRDILEKDVLALVGTLKSNNLLGS